MNYKLSIGSVLGALLMLISLNAFAQENGNRDANGKIKRGPYETNRFFDNIFIGVAGGVNVYEGEFDTQAPFGDRIAPALDVNIGKWFTPSVGARIGYSGLNAKGYALKDSPYAKGAAEKGYYTEKFGVAFIHADAMWNISNAIGGYKETRTWNFVPFVGGGVARSYANDRTGNEFAAHVGLLNNIRLCDLLDLTLEARQMFVNQRFDQVTGGRRREGMSSVTVGLTFKLNRRGFNRVQTVPAIDPTEFLDKIKALENANSSLENRNKALVDENTALKNRKPETVTVKEISATPVVVFFNIGKATVSKKDKINLEYVADAIKANPGKTYNVYGYADEETGTESYNMKLSQKRADAVAKELVKLGVNENQLRAEGMGCKKNLFEGTLNRAAIVFDSARTDITK